MIKPQFDTAWSFHDGYAGVKVGDKWGYAKIPGENVTPANPKMKFETKTTDTRCVIFAN